VSLIQRQKYRPCWTNLISKCHPCMLISPTHSWCTEPPFYQRHLYQDKQAGPSLFKPAELATDTKFIRATTHYHTTCDQGQFSRGKSWPMLMAASTDHITKVSDAYPSVSDCIYSTDGNALANGKPQTRMEPQRVSRSFGRKFSKITRGARCRSYSPCNDSTHSLFFL